jgi:hypothetical protein
VLIKNKKEKAAVVIGGKPMTGILAVITVVV